MNSNGFPFFFLGLIEVDSSELDDGVSFDVRELFVVVEVGGCEVLPVAVVYLETPFGGCITAILSTIQFQQVVSSSCIHTEVK